MRLVSIWIVLQTIYKYFVHQKMLSDLMPLCMKLIHQRQFKFRLLDWHHLVLRQTLSVLNFPAGLILYYHIVLSTVCFCHDPRNSTPRIRPHHNPPPAFIKIRLWFLKVRVKRSLGPSHRPPVNHFGERKGNASNL